MNKITREEFMEFFRSDEFHEKLTVDDCQEIFLNCLHGSSDITRSILEELGRNYGVDIDNL